MGVHSSAQSVRSKRGKHRASTQRHLEPYAWLGAGAITLGLGAAMASGAGIANADAGTDGGSTADTTQSASAESPSKAGGSEPGKDNPDTKPGSTVGSTSDIAAKDDETSKPDSATKSNLLSQANTGPATSVSASGGNVKTVIDGGTKTSSLVNAKNSDNQTSSLAEAKEPAKLAAVDLDGYNVVQSKVDRVSVDNQEPVDHDQVTATPAPRIFGTASTTITPEDTPAPLERAIAAVSPATTPDSTNKALQTLTLTTTAAAVDPSQPFRDVDPGNIYLTPASQDWVQNPNTYTDEEYAAAIGNSIAHAGTGGFEQTASGTLQYTNYFNQNVAVLYGPSFANGENPIGITIVPPGQTAVLPYPDGTVAQAQLPRTSFGQINIVGIAVVGYAPFEKVPSQPANGPIRTYPSNSPFITAINSILTDNSFSKLVTNLGDIAAIIGFKTIATVANFVGGLIYGYNQDYVGLGLSAVESAGNGVMTAAADTKNPLLYLIGTAITTTSYTLNLAYHSDFSDPGSTASYAITHPAVVVTETFKAAGQVLGHFGAAVLGSFGGFLGIFR